MNLIALAKELLGCDDARIESPLGETKFLIIGNKRHTKDDKNGQWYKNGEPYDFEYTEWKVICSADTEEKLLTEMHNYKRLSEMSLREWIESIIPPGPARVRCE